MRRLLALVAAVALIGAALWFRERREGDGTAPTGGAGRGGGERRRHPARLPHRTAGGVRAGGRVRTGTDGDGRGGRDDRRPVVERRLRPGPRRRRRLAGPAVVDGCGRRQPPAGVARPGAGRRRPAAGDDRAGLRGLGRSLEGPWRGVRRPGQLAVPRRAGRPQRRPGGGAVERRPEGRLGPGQRGAGRPRRDRADHGRAGGSGGCGQQRGGRARGGGRLPRPRRGTAVHGQRGQPSAAHDVAVRPVHASTSSARPRPSPGRRSARAPTWSWRRRRRRCASTCCWCRWPAGRHPRRGSAPPWSTRWSPRTGASPSLGRPRPMDCPPQAHLKPCAGASTTRAQDAPVGRPARSGGFPPDRRSMKVR